MATKKTPQDPTPEDNITTLFEQSGEVVVIRTDETGDVTTEHHKLDAPADAVADDTTTDGKVSTDA